MLKYAPCFRSHQPVIAGREPSYLNNSRELSMKPYAVDQRERESRQRAYQSAKTVAGLFPGIEELTVEMRFSDPDRKLTPSPHRRIFVPGMQAFFDFQCPLKDCVGGGFDMSQAVPEALSRKKSRATAGKLSCQGKRKRAAAGESRCLLELDYHVSTFEKRAAA